MCALACAHLNVWVLGVSVSICQVWKVLRSRTKGFDSSSAQAVVGHLLSDAGATSVGGDESLSTRSGLGSVGARDDVNVSKRCLMKK